MYYDSDIASLKSKYSFLAKTVTLICVLLAIVAIATGIWISNIETKICYNVPVKIEHPTKTAMLDYFDTLESVSERDVTDSLAYDIMLLLDIQHPHIAMAQMKLESGHYQSKLAKENNNYFGMRHPCQRTSVSLGDKNGYAKYRGWAYSILDYALWQREYARNLTEDDYLTKLSNSYAEDEKYVEKIKIIAKKFAR